MLRFATSREAHSRAHRRLRVGFAGLLLAVGALGPAGALAPVAAAPIAATAFVTPTTSGLGQTVAYSVTVKNIGTLRIGSVLIRPPLGWTGTACVGATLTIFGACYWSTSTPALAILPGASRTFMLSATSPGFTLDRTGFFIVLVGPVASPSLPFIPAIPTAPGLLVKAHAFLLTDAVVATGPVTIGAACPAANKTALAGSSVTIVICGTNRATIGLTPQAADSSLAGTFIGTAGTFSSATIPAGATNVVLAKWTNTIVTGAPATGRTVIAKIGSSPFRTSPLTTFTGYTAIGPDLTIAKSHTGNFSQGDTGDTYKVSVSNVGAAPTSGTVTVSDTLPAGLTPTGAAGTGWTCPAPSGQTVTCTRSDVLAPSASYPDITITVNVAPNAPSTVTNTANVSGGGEFNTANDSASDPTTINAGPDLTIAKSHTGTITQGDTGKTYKVKVTNSGGAPTTGTVTVSDTLPTGLTPTSATGTGWTCLAGGQAVTCTRSDALAAGNSYPDITIVFNVAANATTATNTATVSGGNDVNTSNNSASDPTTVAPGADLTIAKSHTGNFTQGDTGDTYAVKVTNSGTGVTSGTVTVSDTLPASLTPTGAAGTGWSCGISSQTVTCTRSDPLSPSASYPDITITVNVAANAPASVSNTATVSGGGETKTANDSSTDSTTINNAPDLTIAKSHTGNFSQGDTGDTYKIKVTNSGGVPTSGTVTVSDTLPAGLTATNISGTNWSCTLGTLTCTRSDALNPASSYEDITLTVNVAPNAPSTVTNSVTVSGGGEFNTANDTATDPTTVNAGPDLTIAKSHTGNFKQGDTGKTYKIAVSNGGGAPTSGTVTVTDTLPVGLTATNISGTNWSCTLGTLTCTRSDALAASASYEDITLTVDVAANAPATVTNTASVSGGNDVNNANNSASDPTTVNPGADLTIDKSHTGNFTQGQTGATYTVTVTNSGTGVTSGTVTVTDTLPTGLTPTGAAGTGWGCGISSQTVTCSRSDALSPSASYENITITVNVSATAPASVDNTATVSGGGETNTANDSDTDSTTINNGPDLTIAKSHSGNFSQGDVGKTYTIKVTNGGAAPTSGTVNVVDTLPAGLTATAISGTNWLCTLGTLTCTRSDALAASASYEDITLTVNVAPNAPSTVTNSVTVSGGGETNTGNDSASDPTTVNAGPDLTIDKSHTGNFTQGDTGDTYKITISNGGGAPTSGTVTVTDTLPVGLTATAISGTNWLCTLGTLTCTRSDALAASASYEDITLTVNVAANAPATVTNTADVSGGNDVNNANNSDSDPTTVAPGADLTIDKSHSTTFTQGDTGDTYKVVVTNSGTGITSGTVTVTDTLPTGLTPTGAAGTGWSCGISSQTVTCTESDPLSPSASYPDLTITVDVSVTATTPLDNTATVSGGGETNTANDSDTDSTTINTCSPPTTPSGTIPALTYNTAMAPVTFTTTGGCGAITWSASGLPAGIGIDPGTGIVSGTPTQTGSFPLATITATDAAAHAAPKMQTVTVAPKLVDDTYSAVVGNTQLVGGSFLPAPTTPHTTDPNGVLVNDTADVPIVAAVVVDAPTTNSGSISIDASGNFVYTPPVGYTGTDTYTYTASANGVSSTATITFTISAMVWYVNNTNAGAADGRSNTPYPNVASAETASSANQIIYVHTGVATTPGNALLKSGQTLRGAGSALTVGALSIPAGSKPTLSGTVTLANTVKVDGFDMSTGTGTAVTNAATTVTGIVVDIGSITTTSGTGVTVTGSGNTGTLTFASITTTGGTGFIVANFASPGTFTLNGGTIGASAVIGGSLTSVTAATLKGVTINDTTMTALTVNTTPVTLAGALTIATTAGGTGVAFTGGTATIDAAANAFSITNTSTGRGIDATAGTFGVTGSNNTISTATGIALRSSGAAIDGIGLTFVSISSNGATNGILLSNTGANAGLTVTGSGSAGTGGTIQNSTASGISLDQVKGLSLSWMNLTSNGNAHDEDNLTALSVSGTALLDNDVFTPKAASGTDRNAYFAVPVGGPATGMLDLTVSNTTFHHPTDNPGTHTSNPSTNGEDSLLVSPRGTWTANVTIHDSTFNGAVGEMFQLALNESSKTTLNVHDNTFDNSTYYTNSASLGSAVTLNTGASGNPMATYTFTNNTFTFGTSNDLAISPGGVMTFSGTITGNTFGTSGQNDSGGGDALYFNVQGGGTSNATIQNNNFFKYQDAGIYFIHNNDGSGAPGHTGVNGKYKIYGNTFGPRQGTAGSSTITADIGVPIGTDNSTVCMDIGGAGANSNTLNGTAPNLGTDVALIVENTTNHIDLPGYGTTDDGAAVPAYIAARNSAGTTAVGVGAGANTSFRTIANCN